jgi:hypothetical protein
LDHQRIVYVTCCIFVRGAQKIAICCCGA